MSYHKLSDILTDPPFIFDEQIIESTFYCKICLHTLLVSTQMSTCSGLPFHGVPGSMYQGPVWGRQCNLPSFGHIRAGQLQKEGKETCH